MLFITEHSNLFHLIPVFVLSPLKITLMGLLPNIVIGLQGYNVHSLKSIISIYENARWWQQQCAMPRDFSQLVAP